MKQALILAALGTVYALAALVDAPIVSQEWNWCGVMPYAGPGWFAVGSAAFGTMLLGAALYRVLGQAGLTASPRGGVESVAPAPKDQPILYFFLDGYHDSPHFPSTGLFPAVIGSG